VRAQAIRQLGTRRANSPAITTALAAALRDADGAIRFRAATALGRIAAPVAIAPLTAALDEKDLFTRYAAFTALTRIGTANPGGWPQIAAGLTSENAAVREGTFFAMREAFVPQNAAALIAFAGSESAAPEARATALATRAELQDAPIARDGKGWGMQPVLREAPLLKSDDWAGTAPVLAAVATAGHAAVVPDLRAMFIRETEGELRKSILRTLGKTRGRSAGPPVATVLEAPPKIPRCFRPPSRSLARSPTPHRSRRSSHSRKSPVSLSRSPGPSNPSAPRNLTAPRPSPRSCSSIPTPKFARRPAAPSRRSVVRRPSPRFVRSSMRRVPTRGKRPSSPPDC
jgi:hypothetical protein